MVEINLEDLKKELSLLGDIEAVKKRLEELAKGGLGLKEIHNALEAVAPKFGLTTNSINEMIGSLHKVVSAVVDFVDVSEIMARGQKMASDLMREHGDSIEEFKRRIGDAGISTGALAVKFAMLSPPLMRIQDVPKHFTAMGDSAKTSQAQITDLIQNTQVLSKFTDIATSIIPGLDPKDITKYAQMIDANRNLQRGMMQTAAAGGNLSEFLRKTGADFSGLDAITTEYNDKMHAIAKSTGRTMEEVAKFDKQLSVMPGALKAMDAQVSISGTKMNMLEAALRFADGSGQDATKVFENLAFASSTLGLQGEDALQFLDRMKQVADATHLPMEELQEAIKASATEFAMLGDNTDAAINLMGRLAPALRDVGVAPAQVHKIFKELTSSISGMGTAQKAFLSQSTGGAAGLQGAFQIEQMMADGKMDQVFSKMQQNLRSKMGGGPIVTREQAGQSPEQAAQYQKQVMLMMSPAMGGMAKDTGSAAKLLEAMSKGDLNQFAKGMTGDSEQEKDIGLQKTMQVGSKIQEKTNSILIGIAADMARVAGNSANALGKLASSTDAEVRDVTGYASRQEELNKSAATARDNPLTGKSHKVVDSNSMFEQVAEGISEGDIHKAGSSFVGLSQTPIIKQSKETKTKEAEDQFREPEELSARQVNEARGFKPEKRTEQIIQRTEAQAQQGAGGQVQKVKQDPVHVNVTTVCSVCDKKVAQDAAKEAIKHHHGSTLNQAQTGAGR